MKSRGPNRTLSYSPAPVPTRFSSEEWEQGTISVLRKIAGHVGRIMTLRPTPILPFDAIDCLVNQVWQRETLPFRAISTCSVENAGNDQDETVYAALKRASLVFPNAEATDLNNLVCPDQVCRAAFDDSIVFRDEQHLTDSFVRQIARQVLRQTRLAELQPPDGANAGAGDRR